MDVRERSPGEREEAEGKDNAGDAAQRETLFGSEGHATTGNEFADVTLVVKDVRDNGLFIKASEYRQELVGGEEIRRKRDTYADHAETDRDESEARDSGRPAASVLEDEREGAEETVKHTVHASGVQSEERADGLFDEQEEGAQQGGLHLDGERCGEHWVQVVHRSIHLAGLFLECCGAAAKEDGGVGLGVERAGEEHDERELVFEDESAS